ncbi:hypothetical protein [Streptomyces sp. 1222.5]|uniref:hypothetical protein n=1 Tax=Streptomyces sp. 1222.5 TaxID=1881026 RepID=UPI003EBE635D
MILHDAAEAFTLIIERAILTVQLLAACLAFVLCVIALAAGPLFAPRTRYKPLPHWARQQPLDYEEAA